MSVRFPADPTIDEGEYIDRVLDHCKIKGHTVTPQPEELIRDIRQMHWHHETIIPGASMYLEWCLMKRARELGYKVIIDGQGGDEVFAGYANHFNAYLARLGTSKSITDQFRAILMGAKRNRRLRKTAKHYSNAWRRFSSAEAIPWHRYQYYKTKEKDWEEKYGGDGMPEREEVDFFNFAVALEQLRTSLPSNLYSGDRNSMAHGIECRYPFLDYELVDFANSIKEEFLICDAWTKYILRKVVETTLPPEITWRVDKVGFAAPQDKWMVSKEAQDWISERIFDSSLESLDGYSKFEMQDNWNEIKNSDGGNHQMLWSWASAAELIDMQRCNSWSKAISRDRVVFDSKKEIINGTKYSQLGDYGYLREHSENQSAKTAWIISYTPVFKEPRVIRQAMTLKANGWRVVVCRKLRDKRALT